MKRIRLKCRNGGPADWAITWIIAIVTAIVLIALGDDAEGATVDDAVERARAELRYMPDNCLYVAGLTKRYLDAAGPNSYRLIIIRRDAPTDHAILCDAAGTCVDNGFVAARSFPLEQAAELGRLEYR